jgi:hypothetical protein
MSTKKLFITLLILFFMISSCKKEDVDYTYEIHSVQWADAGSDFDQDGYITNRSLSFFITLLENVQRDIVIKVYYKLSETREYIFYSSMEKSAIIGGEDTPVTIQLGLEPELAQGMYSFQIEVYENGSTRLEASYEIENILFERLATDQNYDLTAWWTDEYDYDYDGYFRSANLNLDVDVTSGIRKEIRIEVLYKREQAETDYTSFFKSDYYWISGQDKDTLLIPTGEYPDTLGFGSYTFKVIVMERNVFSPVLIYDDELENNLGQRQFETYEEDGYEYRLNFDNTMWKSIIDNDGDGYSQARILRLDMDIDKDEPVDLIAKIFRKGDADDDFLVMDSTDIFTIRGSSISDTVLIPVNNLTIEDTLKMPHGEWSFMLAVFRISPTNQQEERFAIDTIDASFFLRQLFELADEDI